MIDTIKPIRFFVDSDLRVDMETLKIKLSATVDQSYDKAFKVKHWKDQTTAKSLLDIECPITLQLTLSHTDMRNAKQLKQLLQSSKFDLPVVSRDQRSSTNSRCDH